MCRKFMGYLFTFCEQERILINPVKSTLQVVIIGRDYINHTDAIAKHKGEREILVAPNFLLNLNPLTNPS